MEITSLVSFFLQAVSYILMSFPVLSLNVSISFHVVTLCAAISSTIILQSLESNKQLLTCDAQHSHTAPGDQSVEAKSTGTCALFDQ